MTGIVFLLLFLFFLVFLTLVNYSFSLFSHLPPQRAERIWGESSREARRLRALLSQAGRLTLGMEGLRLLSYSVGMVGFLLFFLKTFGGSPQAWIGSLLGGWAILYFLGWMLPKFFASEPKDYPSRFDYLCLVSFGSLSRLFSFSVGLPFLKAIRRREGGLLSALEELPSLKEDGKEIEELEEEEKEMIQGVFEFADTTVREVMVPRIDVISANLQNSVDEVLDLIVKYGHSRIPLYDKKIDNIVGIIYAKDLLQNLHQKGKGFELRKIARKAYFVPESKGINELLREFKKKRIHMAVVVDEYGGTAGLVTLEDLLEEIVGEIQDEYDQEEQLVTPLTEGTFSVGAMVSIDDLNEQLGIDLPTEDYETLGGFLYDLADSIPQEGVQLEYEGVNFLIKEVKGQRITKVELKLPQSKIEEKSLDKKED